MKNAPRARDIMNRRPLLLAPQGPVRDAARLLIQRRVAAAPVVDAGKRFVGVFSQHGLMLALVHAAHHELPAGPVSECLEPPPPELDEDAGLMRIAQTFVDAGHAHPLLPVLSEGKLVGTITRRDLSRALLRALAAARGPVGKAVYLSSAEAEDVPFMARPPQERRRGGGTPRSPRNELRRG